MRSGLNFLALSVLAVVMVDPEKAITHLDAQTSYNNNIIKDNNGIVKTFYSRQC